mgnify:CR=1 FL=1
MRASHNALKCPPLAGVHDQDRNTANGHDVSQNDHPVNAIVNVFFRHIVRTFPWVWAVKRRPHVSTTDDNDFATGCNRVFQILFSVSEKPAVIVEGQCASITENLHIPQDCGAQGDQK